MFGRVGDRHGIKTVKLRIIHKKVGGDDLNKYDRIVVQTIAMIAENHGCHLTNVNIGIDKHGECVGLIEIDGPEEKKQGLAQAIEIAIAIINNCE